MGEHLKTPVGILGGGRWGLALACAVARNGHPVMLHSRRDERPDGLPSEVEVTAELGALARHARLLLMAVPSDVVREVARSLGDVVDGAHLIVHGIRGLSGEGLTPISEVLREETPCRRVGALGGPALADDLIEGRPSVLAVASRYPEVTDAVRNALQGPLMRVSVSHDLVGLEWSSALNGALFVALGYARAIGVSPALLGGFLTRGLHEAARIAVAAGADERSLFGVAGVGDLLAAMSQYDRPECQLGAALAEGATLAEAQARSSVRVEAATLVPRVVAFAKEHRLDAAIFTAIEAVFSGRVTREAMLSGLMERR
nr:NAD(P)-binding domain-containing protein [Deltaproteobacteria bacterium]